MDGTLTAIRAAPEKPGQHDGAAVEQGRQDAPDEVETVVGVGAQQHGHGLREKEGERAVDEERVAGTRGIARSPRGVEEFADRARPGDRSRHHGEEVLVRVEVLTLVPVEAGQA
jgi:hypothetical protein